ncbi:hypothetical protein [Glutamicibacter sp.]|uniref:hypothetical protein n=1 Tax=Glutamicibacter sp. TaxID=1931995 RepID=UPI0028BDBB95|nr:hypothetical protein [Glutamicibacter sp.]
MCDNRNTPSTEQVRGDFATRMAPWCDDTRRAAFDRWLEQVRAEAKAEALTEAARDVFDTEIPAEVARWLEARAQQVKEGR